MTEEKYIVEELHIDNKKYFHIYCICSRVAGNATYSVVHLWERLDKWIEHYKKNHKCGVNV